MDMGGVKACLKGPGHNGWVVNAHLHPYTRDWGENPASFLAGVLGLNRVN